MDQNRPVSRIVSLLKHMLEQLVKDAAEDEEAYNKMSCWCGKHEKTRIQAAADADARISELTASVEAADCFVSSSQHRDRERESGAGFEPGDPGGSSGTAPEAARSVQ